MWGLPGPESEMMTVPSRGWLIAGLNVTSTAHAAPAAKLDGQVLVSAKSIPETVMSLIVKGEVPVLVRVALFGSPETPTGCDPKSILSGASKTMLEVLPDREPLMAPSCAFAANATTMQAVRFNQVGKACS